MSRKLRGDFPHKTKKDKRIKKKGRKTEKKKTIDPSGSKNAI